MRIHVCGVMNEDICQSESDVKSLVRSLRWHRFVDSLNCEAHSIARSLFAKET